MKLKLLITVLASMAVPATGAADPCSSEGLPSSLCDPGGALAPPPAVRPPSDRDRPSDPYSYRRGQNPARMYLPADLSEELARCKRQGGCRDDRPVAQTAPVGTACAPVIEQRNVDRTLSVLRAKSREPGFAAVGLAVAQIEDAARAAKSPAEKTQIEIEGLLNRFANRDAAARADLPELAKDFFDTSREPEYIRLARAQFNLRNDAQARELVRGVKTALTTGP